MQNPVERVLEVASFCFGQISVREGGNRFVLRHRDDDARDDLETFANAEDAIEIARYDDAGNYRPLKTAPNLRHGWRMELGAREELKRALDHFYPGRLAVLVAWQRGRLRTTPLRETLDRQSGMFRIAAKISDAQIDDLVLRQQNCQRKSLILPGIRSRHWVGRGLRPHLQFRCFARRRATF